jgi:hypothetical protein
MKMFVKNHLRKFMTMLNPFYPYNKLIYWTKQKTKDLPYSNSVTFLKVAIYRQFPGHAMCLSE